MSAYYNEIDPFAVEWLKKLIEKGHIAPGDVDNRSIADVQADDLKKYDQCHFFAGIGVWSYALKQAGIADNTSVWTGSCPCQPFSSAGNGKGTADERHLWPQLYRLVKECRPPRIVGEQVAGKGGTSWFDLVQADLAQENYSAGMVVFPACSIGAPHQRQRLYWVAENTLVNNEDNGRYRGTTTCRNTGRQGSKSEQDNRADVWDKSGRSSKAIPLADSAGARSDRISTDNNEGAEMERPVKPTADVAHKSRRCETSPLANANQVGCEGQCRCRTAQDGRIAQRCTSYRMGNAEYDGYAPNTEHGCYDQDDRKKSQGTNSTVQSARASATTILRSDNDRKRDCSTAVRPNATNGYWADPDWLYCRDDKWRPVRPRSFPLVDGATNRVGRLRGYGNAIVAPQAQAFIEAVFEV